jgi:hypothetical protein
MNTVLRLTLALACATLVFAADISGKWKLTFTLQDQTLENDLVMKVEGDKVTGTMTSPRLGEAPLQEGKISGDDVSFVVVRDFGGNELKLNYKGKVSGAEIKFQVDGGQFSFEGVAKRAQ